MTTVGCIVIHVRTVCIYIYVSKNKYRHICIKYITKLLRLGLLPCYRMTKSGTFSKRCGEWRIDLEKSRLEIGPKPPCTGIGAVWRLAGRCTDEASERGSH